MIAPVLGKVGSPVTFEGYADDYGNHIVALEFSLDGGKTWAEQDTSSSDLDLMIHWTYSCTPKKRASTNSRSAQLPKMAEKSSRRSD